MTKICAQGEFDGACFLYSIANSYASLNRRKPTQKRWDESLKWIPFSNEFLSDAGTVKYDEDISMYEFTISRLLKEFFNNTTFKVHPFTNEVTPQDVKGMLSDDSVVILNIDSKHWVVVVDSSENELHIACSYELVSKGVKYKESESANYLRPYNRVMPIQGENWIHTPSEFRIQKIV